VTDPIRVLRLIARMNIGGPAWQVKMLADGLDPQCFKQMVVFGDVAEGEDDFFSLPNTELPSHVETRHIPGFGRSVRPWDDLKVLQSIRRTISEFRPHIVHTHTAKAGTLGRMANQGPKRAAAIHSFHGHVLRGYFSPVVTKGIIGMERLLARSTDMFFAEGSVVRDDLWSFGIGKDRPWEVIAPGIAVADPIDRQHARRELGIPIDAPVIGFIGRLTKIKRPDRLAAVFHEVRKAVPGVHLVVAGGGDLMDSFRNELGPDRSEATLLGFTSRVPEVIAASDLVLLTSDNEGMPYTLIEAQMAGTAVVTTNVGSVKDVVKDGVTGRLCSTEVMEIANAVTELLREPDQLRTYSDAAETWARAQFSVDRLANDVGSAYMRVAELRDRKLRA
jgi:glycosyltransferase involved in cell wall biosynthesis